MNKSNINLRRRKFLLLALLLAGGIASAQNTNTGVTIKGNVYGGGNLGAVKNVSTGTGTSTVVSKIDSTTVIINGGSNDFIEGTVYGGGKGVCYDEKKGLVEGNSTVIMKRGMVKRSIYGGGEMGSVGTFTEYYTTVTNGHLAGEPKTCYTGTGLTKVRLIGGQVGLNSTLMPSPQNPDDDFGYVFAGSRGEADSLTNYNPSYDPITNPNAPFQNKVSVSAVCYKSYLEIGGSMVITASAYGGSENGMVMNGTHVKMTGGQIGVGLVEKHLDANNHWVVTTNGPYLGTGWDGENGKWNLAIQKIKNGTLTDADITEWGFHRCDSWEYTYPYDVYDPYYDDPDPLYNPTNPDPQHPSATYQPANSRRDKGTNGHTYFGNLFGGGSGFYSFQPGVWRRSAGRVWGDVLVEISGGHILSSVYGGNEISDVKGKATVNMTGGTVGVPRTLADLEAQPLTCYLYGAGKGDQRVWANQWTNVSSTEVNVTGGTVFGSVFGGGEDGHVLGDVELTVNIGDGVIGTWGYSSYDGNIFTGGRGFSPEVITAGTVCGNTNLTITSGTILGSVFGGGRNGSVGLELRDVNDPLYAQMPSGNVGKTTVKISGCTIGNDHESKLHRYATTKGGNVYGGSLGSITNQVSNVVNPMWPMAAKVKSTDIEIDGATTIIKGNVYGGCGYGSVAEDTKVTVKDGTIWRNVYGGGLGSDDDSEAMTANYISINNGTPVPRPVTPMRRAGRVERNTYVSIEGGWVKKSVYGGGEFGSVGFYASEPDVHPEPTDYAHPTTGSPTHLSWPVGFEYKPNTGTANVEITGGRIGITGKDYMGPWATIEIEDEKVDVPVYYAESDEHQTNPIPYDLTDFASGVDGHGVKALKEAREDNGDVYGAGKGEAGDRYRMATLCNVDNTVVTINQTTTDANPGNYKPNENSNLYLRNGNKVYDFIYQFLPTYTTDIVAGEEHWNTYASRACIAGALYGGGENGHVNTNTNVKLIEGLVGHNLYGGGKGTDSYRVTLTHWNSGPTWNVGDTYNTEITSITAGKVYGNTNVTVDGGYVVRNVYGGGNRASVGKANYASGPGDYYENGYGEAWTTATQEETQALMANSGHAYVYINHGQIGTANGMKDDFPTGNVYGSCRGEAADPTVPPTLTPRFKYSPEFFLGYVNHTHVRIGKTEPSTLDRPTEGNPRLFGSVYGGGEDGHVRWATHVEVNDGEIGNAFTSTNPDDMNKVEWLARGNVYGAGSGLGKYKANDDDPGAYNYASGSVTQHTEVTINGGILHRNVYGGGSLAAVGPLKISQTEEPTKEQSLNKVTINSTVGTEADFRAGYGGYVYGAGRGIDSLKVDLTPGIDLSKFSTSANTEVNLGSNALVFGNVYGGGELGQVRRDAEVNMAGGRVGLLDYGTNSVTHVNDCGRLFGGGKGANDYRDAALVKRNTNVTMSGGKVLLNVYGGGEIASVGERDIEYSETNPNQMISIAPKPNTGLAKVTITHGEVGPAPAGNIEIALNSQDGYVFGGGKGIGDDELDYTSTPPHPSGRYWQFADVNYTSVMIGDTTSSVTTGPHIWGSIFGGAEDGHVLGSDTVRLVKGLIGTKGTTSWDGNIFGGGRNYQRKNFTAGYTGGNILVEMTGGQILGSIFGGGRLAMTGISPLGIQSDGTSYWTFKVGENTGKITVRVKGGIVGNENLIEEWTSSSMGDVYGGGKGIMDGLAIYDDEGHPTHDPAAALLFSLTRETHVIISDSIKNGNVVSSPIILGSVFGGGEVANVGNYGWTQTGLSFTNIHLVSDGKTHVTVNGGTIGATTVNGHASKAQMRYELASTANDGNYNLKYNDDRGHVFGGGEGRCDNPLNYATNVNANPTGVENGAHNMNLIDVMATVDETEVTISGSAFVKGSVYGGGMNGHVLSDTKVTVSGGQVGAGYNSATGTELPKYEETAFFNPLDYDNFKTDRSDILESKALYECYQWEYDSLTVRPFDLDSLKHKPNYKPTDGKSWFGNVFGGGSGFYPYFKETPEGSGVYKAYWNRDCGKVYGNSTVEITGGHILTSVYGGSEMTDVGHFTYSDNGGKWEELGGTATVTMSGGTLGVPRTLEQINKHPVTCYLFGAGKGDPRDAFNTHTNIHYANVEVKGGTVYGSIFGGGEDGHIIGDAMVTVSNIVADAAYVQEHEGVELGTVLVSPIIGTTGHSYVDGNIFGGGRGFTSEALTAGVVNGNVKVNIGGGTMLGSIYGGGRLAPVGTYLVPANHTNYGRFMPDVPDDPETPEEDESQYLHGHIVVNITGGTIGNDYESIYTHKEHTKGGNVFGACMGRLNNVDGTINNRWPLFGVARTANVNISQASSDEGKRTTIRGTVYGGGEYGVVIDTTYVHVSGGTIWNDVYGAGRGSTDETEITYIDPETHQSVTTDALKRSARVVRNSHVLVDGGWIKRCVFGAGDLASIGSITNYVAHDQPGDNYALSWPFEFVFAPGTGRSIVEVKGGRIGISGKDFMGPWNAAGIPMIDLGDGNGYVQYNANTPGHKDALKAAREDNGDIYGAGQGRPGDTWTYPHLANVNLSRVEIEYLSPGSNGVVPENYKPYDQDYQTTCFYNLENWTTYGARECIAGAVYGGSENGHVNDSTYVHLKKGLVGHAVYGGGKGSGTYTVHVVPTEPGEEPYDEEHYSITAGKVFGNTHVLVEGGYVVRNVFGGGNAASVGKANFLGYGETGTPIPNNGRCIVEIKGGTLGMLPVNKTKPGDVLKDKIPYGSVFGGARGFVEAKCDVQGSEESRMSYVSSTKVIIGDNNGGPTILGSVYGGGQDGHVRHTTDVTINKGEIGVAFVKPSTASTTVGSDDPDSEYWVTRGNVFGGGSGISTYKNANNVDTYSLYAGSVFETTNITIKDGTIHRNVYGGGSLALVGCDLTEGNTTAIPEDPENSVTGTNGKSLNRATVTIMGGQVGVGTDVNGSYTVTPTPGSGNGGREGTTPTTEYFTYGGSVFGAGRGFESDEFEEYCTVDSTNVKIQTGNVYGEVYGGAENGHVVYDTRVLVSGGTIGTIGNTGYDGNVFGGGKGSGEEVPSTITITDPDSGEVLDTYEYVTLNLYKDCGRVGGNTYVKVTDGYIKGSIYGGGSLALTGVNEEGEFPYDPQHPEQWAFADHGNTFITVKGTSTKLGTEIANDLLHTDASVGDIFGSGKGDIDNYDNVLAGRTTSTTINVSESPTIYGTVFGGGEMASVGWWGTDGQFFGNTEIGKTGKTNVNINGSPVIGTAAEFALTPAANPDDNWWTMFENGKIVHTCTGNVFGGSQGDVYPKFGHWVSMGRSRETEVSINLGDDGLIRGTVYGGSEQGSVIGNTKVTVDGTGTIGSYINQGTGATTPYYFGGVFAAGYGSDDSDEDNDDIHPNDSTDLRDGLDLEWTPAVMAGRVYGDAQADILGCTIYGGVYGGGERAYVGYERSNTYGNVTVNIGSRSVVNSGQGDSKDGPTYTYSGDAILIHSDVFGANKYKGTPYGNTNVNVYQTAHTAANTCPTLPTGYTAWTHELLQANTLGVTQANLALFPNAPQQYAIHRVFGGGDRSHYVPHQNKHAHVHVYTCLNTIEDLFGGSNAADIGSHTIGYETNANLTVDGGRFNRVFGGGNGLSEEYPANIHGAAKTYIDGGLINQLFGGSNNYGNIHDIQLDVAESSTTCAQYIDETYGGGNDAPHDGDVVVNVTCAEGLIGHVFYGGANHAAINGNLTVNMMGGKFDYVFGGSKNGSVNYYTEAYVTEYNALHQGEQGFVPLTTSGGGNITLNIYGGKIYEAAFGGNDESGIIKGKITVNVIDNVGAPCNLELKDLYGAGRNATYAPVSPSGQPITDQLWPEVNVIHGTVSGNVFGGGQGASATVTSNPLVNIGFDQTENSPMWQYIPTSGAINTNNVVANATAKVLGSVLGGGNQASVTGNTHVYVRKDNTIIGEKLNFAQRYVTDQNEHQDINFGNVYGGGFGYNDNTPTANDVNLGKVTGNTNVTISGGTVRHNVYGGGRMASVGGTANVTVDGTAIIGPKKADLTQSTPAEKLIMREKLGLDHTPSDAEFIDYSFKYLGGNEGVVYGGGRGVSQPAFDNFAYVNETSVTIGGTAQVVSGVFGGAENGRVETDTHVTIGRENNDSDAPVIGGIEYHGTTYALSEEPTTSAYYDASTTLHLSATDSEIVEDVYGVGRRIFRGGVFGGGRGTDIYLVDVEVPASEPEGEPTMIQVPHFNRTVGWVKGNSNVTINKGKIYGKVYGGGTIASVGTFQYYTYEQQGQNGGPAITITTDSISGYTPGTGKATVTINGGQIGTSGLNNGDVFGGGLGVAMAPGHELTHLAYVGETDVKINPGAVIKNNVYGGSASGHVQGEAHVTVDGGTIGVNDQYGWHSNVFGGGGGTERYNVMNSQGEPIMVNGQPKRHMSISAGRVFGSTFVTINQIDKDNPTEIKGSVYGGGAAASVGGYILGDPNHVGANAIINPTVKCQVDILGGTIGVDGNDNGMVYGSGRGFVKNDSNGFDTFSDSLSYAVQTEVNIGKKEVSNTTPPVTTYSGDADIKGNIYGSGKSGHVVLNSTINFYGGIIDGSVFGGGSGDDPYIVQNNNVSNTAYNPFAGDVSGNTFVNVYGGTIKKNVYGGGELASLKNPYTNPATFGTTNVNIEGGVIGVERIGDPQELITGGIVFGGCLGLAGDNYADYANVGTANVTIKGGTIYNAVFGGGDNGHVMGNTVVAISETDPTNNPTIIGQKLTMKELYVDSLALAKTHIYTGSVLGGGRGIGTIAGGLHSEITGRVYGNATVTVSGGTIRHAVYGGGGLSSVGTYTLGSDGLPSFTSGGTTTVTVEGSALIGPKKEDLLIELLDPDDPYYIEEMARAREVLHISATQPFTADDYKNAAFRFLGLNEGWVFGAGCGLASNENNTDDLNKLTFNDKAIVYIQDNAQVAGVVFGGGENGRVMTSTEVNISGGIIGGVPLHGAGEYTVPDFSDDVPGEYAGVKLNFPASWSEVYEDEYGAGANAFRGSVFGGGKGSDTIVRAHNTDEYRYSRMAGQVFGSTNVNISAGTIYGIVYGGGAISNVGKVTYNNDGSVATVTGGACNVTITGGNLGSDNGETNIDNNTIGRNNGNVFGGGLGRVGAPESSLVNVSYAGSTKVEVKNGAHVPGSVFGGSANGHVMGNSHVIIDGENTVIGTPGMGKWHSNVYGAGGGQHRYIVEKTVSGQTKKYRHLSITSGRVFGNSKVEINGGKVLHNVYGGGAIASVGTYDLSGEVDDPLADGTGKAEVIITGGIIGVDGDNNGMVFGSGRGLACNPSPSAYPECYLDSLSYAGYTEVTIGTMTMHDPDEQHPQAYPVYGGTATINGSVYGSGENGHVFKTATVNIYGGTIGCTLDTINHYSSDPSWLAEKFPFRGNVYGAGCGTDQYDSDNDDIPDAFNPRGGLVWGGTTVNVKGGNISRNVYGGGALASVGTYTTNTSGAITGVAEGTGTSVVIFEGGTIGIQKTNNDNTVTLYGGDVYGGARGPHSVDGFTDKGIVDMAYVYINNGTIYGSVYGGGQKSIVRTSRVTTINGGTIEQDVYGGSDHALIANPTNQNPDIPYTGMKTVNIRGGHIKGNVFGCSNSASEGGDQMQWSGFVNITGGTIDHDVFAAGNGGNVTGSLCVNVGKGAVLNAPTYVDANAPHDPEHPEENPSANQYYNVKEDGSTYNDFNESTADDLPIGKLIVRGDVYGGSHHYGNTNTPNWNHYDVNGFSVVFVDGEGYDTDNDEATNASLISQPNSTTLPYMNLEKGIYGSGKQCESGQLIMPYGQSEARGIVIKDYGHRTNTNNEMTGATRTLTTIQRGGIVVLANSNVHFSGARPISRPDYTTKYAVGRANVGFYCLNGSGIVLGSTTQNDSVMIDSVKIVKSMYLPGNESVYHNVLGGATQTNWETVGIKGDTPEAAKLYRLTQTGTAPNIVITPVELTAEKENVIVFYDKSKMRVRYKEGNTTKYGQLQGFFRMSAESYVPNDLRESFAYARPKYPTDPTNPTIPNLTDGNLSDGGFLSYNTTYNYFVDDGTQYTNSRQYPYLHPYLLQNSKNDVEDYRYWVTSMPTGNRWYVDGTRGWGSDVLKSTDINAGRFPDKPKKTLFGTVKVNDEDKPSGVVNEQYAADKYSYETDMIYVVGALSAADEKEIKGAGDGTNHKKPLKLFRYPGGHVMSNQQIDYGTGSYNVTQAPWGVSGHAGPGMNKGAMVDVQTGADLTMKCVVIDGLYNYTNDDATLHGINTAQGLPENSLFDPTKVTEPLIVTHKRSILTLGDSTVLKRGYNGTNAEYWYTNALYDTVALNASTSNRHGGAIYVDGSVDRNGGDIGATVNVRDTVYITGNKQYLKIGDGPAQYVESNVFLPNFHKSINITGSGNLNDKTIIGVTSPRANNAASYVNNTFSPVAKATTSGIAEAAWQNCNFLDDQDWFFVNKYKKADGSIQAVPKTTYYVNPGDDDEDIGKTLYFGWTWANAVRSKPASFTNSTSIDLNSAEDLAWLISKVNGYNGYHAGTFADTTLNLKADVNLKKYVWVPIGEQGTPFAGNFDGRGHIIENLSIEYIGTGDYQYERTNYGLFGYAENSTINRTFVVSGLIKPEVSKLNGLADKNIGGLVGYLDGANSLVSNSEAAVEINCKNVRDVDKPAPEIVAGGLVAMMQNGKIHSSMAMPNIRYNSNNNGKFGGLVGSLTGTDVGDIFIFNSFVNGEFYISTDNDIFGVVNGQNVVTSSTVVGGGLLGTNSGAKMKNCYVAWVNSDNTLKETNFGSIAASTPNQSVENNVINIDSCYVMQNSLGYVINGQGSVTNCNKYTPVIGADNLGYMCADNRVEMDTTMFMVLNRGADYHNKHNSNPHTYARWARPGLSEINGDLPVLVLSDFDDDHEGDFRCVGTYAAGYALQYGGTVRDTKQVDLALVREQTSTNKDCLFIYGDVTETILSGSTETITQGKVSIYEHASIKSPGALANFANTYVGVTFDNSCGKAYATPGMNAGLEGGSEKLPRDWHMFSTPLSNAPQGFNYQGHNEPVDNYTNYNSVPYSNSGHYNNPWIPENHNLEFSWLNNNGEGDNRYWMKTFNAEAQSTDGYFPTQRGALFSDANNLPLASEIPHLFIVGSDEFPGYNSDNSPRNRYPYGMDFYTWYEPEYHWINFKRNGPNHWHSDVNHDHLDYYGDPNHYFEAAYKNKNEETLIKGKGYMASIAVPTYLQSHGKLNGSNENETIALTTAGFNCTGWNLVGNPYHGYIDFSSLVDNNSSISPFYVVYDADTYNQEQDQHGSGFRCYPRGGSKGGDYAGPYLHPHQGFFVEATGGGTLTFKESMLKLRSEVDDASFRDERPEYPLVNLYLSSDKGCNDLTVVEFKRPEWGGANKLRELREGNGLFYGYHDGERYAALFAGEEATRVPLWFEAKEDDIFTMKWNTANADFNSLYLIDNIQGIQYDMLANDTYTFEGHKQDYYARFYIVFDVTGMEELEGSDDFVFFDGSQWVVTGDGDLDFIDMHGRILRTEHVSGQTKVTLPKVASSVYLFRLSNPQGVKLQKVVVNNY